MAPVFFDFLDHPPSQPPPLLAYLPTSVSGMFASPRAAAHDVSFDLTSSYSSHKITTRPLPKPTPVAMPLEVALSIIEAAYYENMEPDERSLKACALVCRAWSAPAQKLLFSRVTLRTQAACDSFRTAVDPSTQRGKRLGSATVRMQIVLDHNQPFGLSQHSFGHVVTLCSNLYELNLALYGSAAPGEDIVGVPDVSRMRRPAPSFDENTLALLRSGPRITALQFSNWSENQQSIIQLLGVWPTVKSLVISGTPPQLPSTPSEPLACSLEELRMNFQTPPSTDFMGWLLLNSTNTLRILEFEREPSAHLLDYLVDTHRATLHSLSLPACTLPEHALAVQKCRSLRELRIENNWASTKVYRKVSDVLEHLALGLDRNTVLQPVLEIVKSKDSLKVVTVHIWAGGEQHPQLSALKIACAYRGVELRITNDVRLFRMMIRGDPVSPERFPRVTSLINLRIMRS